MCVILYIYGLRCLFLKEDALLIREDKLKILNKNYNCEIYVLFINTFITNKYKDAI